MPRLLKDTDRTSDLCGPDGLRHNNMDVIRFFMAVLVIFSHSYPIAKGEVFKRSGMVGNQLVEYTLATEPLKRFTNGIDSFGGHAVNVFFILSGFLIAMSWERSSSVWNYLKRRFLRIYPGFIVAMLFCAAIICPLFTVAPFKGISTDLMKNWTLSTAVLQEHWVPGVFLNNPDPNALNSSVWTIRFEFGCYLLIILLGSLTLMRRPKALLIVYLFVHGLMISQRILKLNADNDMHQWLDAHRIVANPAIPHWFEQHHFAIDLPNFKPPTVPPRDGFVYHFDTANIALAFDFTYLNRYLGPIPQWTGMITLFSVGMVCYAWRNHIPKRLWLFLLCTGVLTLDLLLCALPPWTKPSFYAHQAWPILYPPLLGYSVFYLAFQRYVWFPHFARFGDFSYGMYLYAFPVQQSLQALMPNNRSAGLIFLLATPITFVLSVLSWYGVERYFIKKKHTRHAQEITHVPAELRTSATL